MKKLYIARHAKSSWECDWLDDFERPLNERGKRDAPIIGQALHQLSVEPDMIVTSPAARASSTARIIARELGYDLVKLEYEERLYDAVTRDILDIIGRTPDSIESLLIVGHNPGFTSTANRLSDGEIDNVPTSGVVGIEFNCDTWRDVVQETGKLLFFEYPKKHKDSV